MTLEKLSQKYLPALEVELRTIVNQILGEPYQHLKFMLNYHMGWEGKGAGPQAQGKRIRPLLLMLTTTGAGGEWKNSLPAAAAIELLHNFSLIHDDIEDNSPTRRNRPTVWNLWGVPQAINTGDTMYSLAYQAMASVRNNYDPETTLKVMEIFESTALELTKGQFMDISFEDRALVSIEEYALMISGKTAALIGAAIEIGAVLAATSDETQKAYRDFGTNLGLAFQVQDDYLGIWGDEELTGKSTATDILEKKKTLPILYGLNEIEQFKELWGQETISETEIGRFARVLEAGGARSFTRKAARSYYNEAKAALKTAHPTGEAAIALDDLLEQLLNRSQ